MASFKIILREDKKDKKGLCPLYMRISHQRKTKYQSIQIKVKPSDWDEESQKVKKSHGNSTRLNNLLAKKLIKYEDTYLKKINDGDVVNTQSLKISKDLRNKNFFDLCDEHLKMKLDEEAYNTHAKVKSVIKKLRTYVNKDSLEFKEIDFTFLEDYRSHLQNYYGNSLNTIHANFRVIRMLLNKAELNDLIKPQNNPFHKFKMKREETKVDYLTEYEVSNIKNLPLIENSLLNHHRNLFLFSCYSCGLRVSDAISLKWSDIADGTLSKEIIKTKSNLTFKLSIDSKLILEKYSDRKDKKYVFPILKEDSDLNKKVFSSKLSSSSALYNKDLKKIAKKCKIEKRLTSHVSRHTWATIALRQGVRIEYVSKLLGHKSIKTTQIYSKVINEELDNAIDQIKF